jgi:hypothetical protein
MVSPAPTTTAAAATTGGSKQPTMTTRSECPSGDIHSASIKKQKKYAYIYRTYRYCSNHSLHIPIRYTYRYGCFTASLVQRCGSGFCKDPEPFVGSGSRTRGFGSMGSISGSRTELQKHFKTIHKQVSN